MSLNQPLATEFSPCTPSAPQPSDLSIQTNGFPLLIGASRLVECSEGCAKGHSHGSR